MARFDESSSFSLTIDESSNIDLMLHQTMRTTILEELNLPEERRAALQRESVRTGKPVSILVREWVLQLSEQLANASTASAEEVRP